VRVTGAFPFKSINTLVFLLTKCHVGPGFLYPSLLISYRNCN